MNWNKLIVIGSVGLALATMPAAMAQRGSRGSAAPRGGAAPTNIGASGARSFQAQAGRRGGRVNAGRSGSFRNGAGAGNHWQNGDRHRWGNHRWHHHHHHGFYPYYAYYPYGYPFWGSSFYFSGNRTGYASGGSGSVIVDVQQELARAGYYRGAVDGVLGSGTRRAIRLYESANGLPVDGRVDSDLLAAMGLG